MTTSVSSGYVQPSTTALQAAQAAQAQAAQAQAATSATANDAGTAPTGTSATAADTSATAAASGTDPGAAVYPLATAPPIRDPSSVDPLLGFAANAQKLESAGSTQDQQAAQSLLTEQQQVLTAFQTALGAWDTATD